MDEMQLLTPDLVGMVADMFHPEEQQHAVLWASLWSCLGAVIGGVSTAVKTETGKNADCSP